MPRRRQARDFIVEVGGDVVLEEFVEFLDNVDWDTGFECFSKFLVDPDNIDQFVCKIIFRPDAGLKSDGWSNRHRWHRHYLQHSPFWPSRVRVQSQQDEIVVRNTFQSLSYRRWRIP